MKVLVLKKTAVVIILVVLIFLSALCVNNTGLSVGAVFVNKKIPIYSVDAQESKLSISFDAAWGADKTRDIMSVCNNYGVKATFFLVGFWVEKYPEMVKEIYNNGFEIGLHSNTHPDMTKLSKSEIKQELETNIKLIENIIGTKPKLFRPPFGYYNNNLLDVCEELNIYCIQWDIDSLDWKGLSANAIAGRVIKNAKNGSIILCHNNSDHIVDALSMIFEYFKLSNKKLVPIGNLIYHNNYRIDNFGKQIKV